MKKKVSVQLLFLVILAGLLSYLAVSTLNATGFFVGQLTVEVAVPAPSAEAAVQAVAGAGAGGGTTKIVSDFSLDTEALTILLFQEQVKIDELKLKNTGN